MENRQPLLQVKNMVVEFKVGRGILKAVNDVSFNIYKGETFSLVGESGSGKTTIGRAIIRLNPVSTGEVIFDDKRISGKIDSSLDKMITRKIQMIFQDPMASLNERAKVSYIVSEGLLNAKVCKSEKELNERVSRALLDVGLLPEFATRFPHEFSGGQKQRIGIARALVMDPDFIIADEPISALDVSIRAQVLNLLNKFKAERGLTYLFIAHDLSVVKYISDRIAVIYKGKIVELAGAEELFDRPMHPYTRSLLSAVPVPNPREAKAKVHIPYDVNIHDYSVDAPSFVEVFPEHFVYGNEKELKEYKAMY